MFEMAAVFTTALWEDSRGFWEKGRACGGAGLRRWGGAGSLQPEPYGLRLA